MAEIVQLDRYEETIRGYEAYPVKTGKVLLYGSSFLRNWGYDRARAQWAQYGGLEVENHGFGGATIDASPMGFLVTPEIPLPSSGGCGCSSCGTGTCGGSCSH